YFHIAQYFPFLTTLTLLILYFSLSLSLSFSPHVSLLSHTVINCSVPRLGSGSPLLLLFLSNLFTLLSLSFSPPFYSLVFFLSLFRFCFLFPFLSVCHMAPSPPSNYLCYLFLCENVSWEKEH